MEFNCQFLKVMENLIFVSMIDQLLQMLRQGQCKIK